ncbi:MAG: CBS domain-containing protein [Terriglobales bacterium]
MTRDPYCCTTLSTAQDAALQMRRWNAGALPVVDSFYDRRLLGIVTDRDLCLAVVATDRAPSQVRLGECMTQHPVCCGADDDVSQALRLMCERHLRRLPVLNAQGVVVGMVSITDLVRYRAIGERELAEAMPQISTAAEVLPHVTER